MQLPGMTRSIKMLEAVCVTRLWTSQNWGAEAGCCCSHQPGDSLQGKTCLRVVCFQLEHLGGAVRTPVHRARRYKDKTSIKKESRKKKLYCRATHGPCHSLCVVLFPPPQLGTEKLLCTARGQAPLDRHFFPPPPNAAMRGA